MRVWILGDACERKVVVGSLVSKCNLGCILVDSGSSTAVRRSSDKA